MSDITHYELIERAMYAPEKLVQNSQISSI